MLYTHAENNTVKKKVKKKKTFVQFQQFLVLLRLLYDCRNLSVNSSNSKLVTAVK